MASNLENEKLLEALFEKYIDMGLSPIEAEKAAYAEFERMTKREEKFFNASNVFKESNKGVGGSFSGNFLNVFILTFSIDD